MPGGSIPAIKVNLRTIRRVNPTMTGFRPALSVMLVSNQKDQTGVHKNDIRNNYTCVQSRLKMCNVEVSIHTQVTLLW